MPLLKMMCSLSWSSPHSHRVQRSLSEDSQLVSSTVLFSYSRPINVESFQVKVVWNEPRAQNCPLHQIWPSEWKIVSKQLNVEVLMLIPRTAKAQSVGVPGDWCVARCAASPETVPTHNAQPQEKAETNPRSITDAFSCCRRMNKLGE